jgi:hypothetical protein
VDETVVLIYVMVGPEQPEEDVEVAVSEISESVLPGIETDTVIGALIGGGVENDEAEEE